MATTPGCSNQCFLLYVQKSLGRVLNSYVYGLTEWSKSGGDDRLSAADAKEKAKCFTEEMITIAKQVQYFRTFLGFGVFKRQFTCNI